MSRTIMAVLIIVTTVVFHLVGLSVSPEWTGGTIVGLFLTWIGGYELV